MSCFRAVVQAAAGAALACSCLSSLPLQAQLPAARLNSIHPCGAQQGTEVEVELQGIDLDEATRLIFSHPGITAKPQMTEPGPLDEEPRPVFTQNNNLFTRKFVVSVAANVPPGMYEAHAVGLYGMTNPRVFVVGELPETLESETNNAREQANEVQLGSVVNGRADGPVDVDWFKFTAQRGQRVLLDCRAQRVDTRMEPGLIVSDAEGNELGRSRYLVRRDTLLDVTLPADGEYYVKLYDFLYRGGPDFGYRLTISTRPHVDFVLPAAGRPGAKSRLTFYGRNLPGGKPSPFRVDGCALQMLQVDVAVPGGQQAERLQFDSLLEPSQSGIDGFEYRLQGPAGKSNPVLIGFAHEEIVPEQEPNNQPAKAQKLKVPCEVAGQFYARNDRDWFTFEAKEGDEYWIEVIGQRLGQSPDPFLLVQQVTRPAEGDQPEQVRELAPVDDAGAAGNVGGGNYNTTTDDPVYRFQAPAAGQYRLMVRDLYAGSQVDPRFVYRLIVRRPRPGFRLVAAPRAPQQNPRASQPAPWAPVLRPGGSAQVDVMVFRRDGFDGSVEVTAEGLPAGVTCPPAVIGPGLSAATLVLSAAENAKPWAGTFRVTGKAEIDGKAVSQPARLGTVVWQLQNNGGLPQARLARSLALAVTDAETAPYHVTLGDGKVWETARGGVLKLPVKVVRRDNFKGNITLLAALAPPNAQAGNLNLGNKSDGTYQLTLRNNTPAGEYTFYVQANSQIPYQRNPQAAKAAEERKKELDKLLAEANTASREAAAKKTAADQAAARAKTAADQAAAQQKTAENALAAAENALKQAADAFDQATAALARNPEDAGLQSALAAAEKAKADAETKRDAAAKDRDEKAAAATAANEAATKAAEEQAAATKAAAEAAQRQKDVTDAQRAAAQRAQLLSQLARNRNTNLFVPSTPARIRVAAMPFEQTIGKAPPLKQGAKVEVPITLRRLFDYADAVTVNFTAPPGTTGLRAANVNIAKGQNQGKLVIEAAANATPGDHPATLRFTCRFNNQTLTLDETLTLTVQEVKQQNP